MWARTSSSGGEAWKEEALDNLPWKDERGPSSIRWTLEPFQRQHWANFREMGWSAYGLYQAQWYHLELLGWSQNKFYWTSPQLKFNLSTVHNFSHAHTLTMYTHFYNTDFHTKARCAATSNLFTYYMHDNIVSNILHNSTFITDVFHCCCFWYTLCHTDKLEQRKEWWSGKRRRWKLITFCCSLNAKEADSELLISVGCAW